jgi:glutamate-1-semialdehyde 2,1-aminomutase
VLGREQETYESRTRRSAERFQRALEVLPGGDTRAVTNYAPYPVAIERAEGAELVDVDGNRYADFIFNYTSLIAGHRHPDVMRAVSHALAHLHAVAAPVPGQIELAAELVRRIPSVEQIRFTNSGSESGVIAVWAARAYTGRELIVKAIGGYHGCMPELERTIRPGSLPPGLPSNAAVRGVPYNDLDALRAAVEEAGDSLACVILEPVLGSGGVVAPEPGYLEGAQALARDAGAVFVLDEVITFRLSPGGYQRLAGLEPDITMLAKIIGGGFPVGAIGGRAEVLEVFRPGTPRSISHSGTFNGNPVTIAAGLETLRLLDDDAYVRLDELGAAVARGLREAIDRTGVRAVVTQVGSLVNVHFTDEVPRDFDASQRIDADAAAAYHIGLLNRGLFVAPRGMMTVSLVTTDDHVRRLVDASEEIFAALA